MTLIGILRSIPSVGYLRWHYKYHRWHPDELWMVSDHQSYGWDVKNLGWWNEV